MCHIFHSHNPWVPLLLSASSSGIWREVSASSCRVMWLRFCSGLWKDSTSYFRRWVIYFRTTPSSLFSMAHRSLQIQYVFEMANVVMGMFLLVIHNKSSLNYFSPV